VAAAGEGFIQRVGQMVVVEYVPEHTLYIVRAGDFAARAGGASLWRGQSFRASRCGEFAPNRVKALTL
jgi:hypothetical protein